MVEGSDIGKVGDDLTMGGGVLGDGVLGDGVLGAKNLSPTSCSISPSRARPGCR